MARLYSDEDFSLKVVDQLRLLGHDVLTVFQTGRGNQGVPDPFVLADAIALGRAVITFNRRHFKRLASSVSMHFGIIACTRDDDVVALAKRIDSAILAAGDMTNQIVRVIKPHKP